MAAKPTAIYIRVSTGKQVKGTSLEDQERRCRAWVDSHDGGEIVLYSDGAVSGALQHRPSLDRLFADARAGRVGRVVVNKIDRIGRSTAHFLALLSELDDLGVEFVSVYEAIDGTTPSGRLHRTILAAFAEFERAVIIERTVSGVAAVASEGYWPAGQPPFGWRTERLDDARHANLVLDSKEAKILRFFVGEFVSGRSTSSIATDANSRGMTRRTGGRWTASKVRRALLADHLSGTFTFRRENNRHVKGGVFKSRYGDPIDIAIPPLLTASEHAALREALQRTSVPTFKGKYSYLLSGSIYSPHGEPMVVHPTNSGLLRYVCRQRRRIGARVDDCGCRYVSAAFADEWAWGELAQLLGDRDRLLDLARATMAKAADTEQMGGDDLDALDRKIGRLERDVGDKVADLLADGMDSGVIRRATRRASEQLDELRARREKVASWAAANTANQERGKRLWEMASDLSRWLESDDFEGRRRVVEILQVKVTVTGWDRCGECGGSGVVGVSGAPSSGVKKRGGKRTEGCPVCRRLRYVPRLSLAGSIPEPSGKTEGSEAPVALPFNVESA